MKETIIKINKTKSWFFEKIKKKTGQTLSQTNKKREREKIQISKIRNKKGKVTTDNVENTKDYKRLL